MNDESIFSQQLDQVLADFAALQRRSAHKDLSDLPKEDRQALVTRGIAAVHRISGMTSTYSAEIARLLERYPHLHLHTTSVLGVVLALRDDLDAGHLRKLSELVHGDMFSDFLEMSEHLLENGYKDAAAVIAGSTLESHLRELCRKANIAIDETGKPKAADRLNTDLRNSSVYQLLDQKAVTAWLGLRNNAAHGNYSAYVSDQVRTMIDGVRNFISRYPA